MDEKLFYKTIFQLIRNNGTLKMNFFLIFLRRHVFFENGFPESVEFIRMFIHA